MSKIRTIYVQIDTIATKSSELECESLSISHLRIHSPYVEDLRTWAAAPAKTVTPWYHNDISSSSLVYFLISIDKTKHVVTAGELLSVSNLSASTDSVRPFFRLTGSLNSITEFRYQQLLFSKPLKFGTRKTQKF